VVKKTEFGKLVSVREMINENEVILGYEIVVYCKEMPKLCVGDVRVIQ